LNSKENGESFTIELGRWTVDGASLDGGRWELGRWEWKSITDALYDRWRDKANDL